jgi:hypothetical protein
MEETRLQKLFRILRACGAAMVIASASTFLVQRWEEVGHVMRYLALLGMTIALPPLGYLCGIRLREGRSARVLMLTLLMMLPIHAGVLGGFVYSQFGLEIGDVASVAKWVAGSKVQALGVAMLSAAALGPLAWGAFRTLSPLHATFLTLVSAGLHALVLVPIRTGDWATFAVPAAFLGATLAIMRVKPNTREAWLSSTSLLLPGFLLTARQLAFYETTQVFFGAIAAIATIGMFVLGRQAEDTALERFAISPALVSGALLASPIQDALHLSNPNATLLIGLLLASAMFGFAWRSERSLFIHGGAWAALQSIALGLGLLSHGFMSRRRVETYGGVAMASTGFIFEISLAIREFGWAGWAALATFGLALVALTAWLERRAQAVMGSSRIHPEDPEPAAKPADIAPRQKRAFGSS